MKNMDETIGAVVFRHGNGSTIVYDGVNEDGFDLGHIVSPEGIAFLTRPIVALLAHGTGWVSGMPDSNAG